MRGQNLRLFNRPGELTYQGTIGTALGPGFPLSGDV